MVDVDRRQSLPARHGRVADRVSMAVFLRYFGWIENAVQALATDGKRIAIKHFLKIRAGEERDSRGEPEIPRPPTQLPIASEFATARSNLDFRLHSDDRSSAAHDDLPLISRPRPIATDGMEKGFFSKGTLPTENISLPIRTHTSYSPSQFNSENKGSSKPQDQEKEGSPRVYSTQTDPSAASHIADGGTLYSQSSRRSESSSLSNKYAIPTATINLITAEGSQDTYTPPTTANLPLPEATKTSPHIRTVQDGITTRFLITPPVSPQQSTELGYLTPHGEHEVASYCQSKPREHHEIHKNIISFINTQADQIPERLRDRLMDAYSIVQADLDREAATHLNDNENGEKAVVTFEELGLIESGIIDAGDLQILSKVFRTQDSAGIETQESTELHDTPQSNMPNCLLDPPEPIGNELPPGWMSVIDIGYPKKEHGHQRNLTRTSSEPNLRPSAGAPPTTSPLATRNSLATLKDNDDPNNDSVTNEEINMLPYINEVDSPTNTKLKANNLLARTLDSMKDVVKPDRLVKMGRMMERRLAK